MQHSVKPKGSSYIPAFERRTLEDTFEKYQEAKKILDQAGPEEVRRVFNKRYKYTVESLTEREKLIYRARNNMNYYVRKDWDKKAYKPTTARPVEPTDKSSLSGVEPEVEPEVKPEVQPEVQPEVEPEVEPVLAVFEPIVELSHAHDPSVAVDEPPMMWAEFDGFPVPMDEPVEQEAAIMAPEN